MVRLARCKALASSALVAVMVGGLPVLAHAQDGTSTQVRTPEPDASDGDSNVILVTARLRQESAQETPVAVTALNAEALTERNVQNLGDLGGVPSVSISSTASPGRARLAIRGVSFTNSDPFQAPAIALTVDGVYYDSTSAAIINTFDLESIEILRGPQGTLFGRNSPGGVINVRSRRPSGDFDVNAEVTVGNYETLDLRFGVDMPIVEGMVDARVAVMRRVSGDSPYTNLATTPFRFGTVGNVNFATQSRLQSRLSDDLEVGQFDTWLVRGILDIQPADNFRATLIGEYLDDNSGQIALKSTSEAPIPVGIITGPGVPGGDDPFVGVNDVTGQNPVTSRTFSATMEYDISDQMQLISITAYRDEGVFNAFDIDGEIGAYLHSYQTWDTEQLTQELRLQTDFDGAFNFIVGGFYMDSELIKVQESGLDRDALCLGAFGTIDPGPPPSLCPIGGFANVAPPNNPPVWAGPFADWAVNFHENVQTTEAWAVFGQAYFDLTEDLRVTVGGRYSWERKDFVTEVYAGQEAGQSVNETNSWANFAPMASIDYQISDDVLAYASYSQAYRSGGYSGRAQTITSWEIPFNEEKVTSYEVGLKADIFDDLMRINVAGFYTDYKDIQRELQVLVPTVGPENLVVNGASATIKGLELEMTVWPTDNLTLRGSASYLDAGYDEFNPTLRPGQVPLEDLDELSSHPLPLAPDWTVSGGFDYTIPTATSGEFAVGMNANYTSEQLLGTIPIPFGSNLREDLVLVDGYVSWTSPNDHWGLRLWVKNLTNQTYVLDGNFGGGITTTTAAGWPRTFGLTASYRLR